MNGLSHPSRSRRRDGLIHVSPTQLRIIYSTASSFVSAAGTGLESGRLQDLGNATLHIAPLHVAAAARHARIVLGAGRSAGGEYLARRSTS
jgi:hypothetical protein